MWLWEAEGLGSGAWPCLGCAGYEGVLGVRDVRDVRGVRGVRGVLGVWGVQGMLGGPAGQPSGGRRGARTEVPAHPLPLAARGLGIRATLVPSFPWRLRDREVTEEPPGAADRHLQGAGTRPGSGQGATLRGVLGRSPVPVPGWLPGAGRGLFRALWGQCTAPLPHSATRLPAVNGCGIHGASGRRTFISHGPWRLARSPGGCDQDPSSWARGRGCRRLRV